MSVPFYFPFTVSPLINGNLVALSIYIPAKKIQLTILSSRQGYQPLAGSQVSTI